MHAIKPAALVALAVMTAIGVAAPASAALLTVVPPGFENMGGNAQGPAPLRFPGAGGSRVQQVYESQLFSGFGNSAQSITRIDFRAFPGSAPSFLFSNTVTVSDIQIRLSTTAGGDEGANQLSANFAANVGANVVTVYTGPLTLTTAANGNTPVSPFDYTIQLQTPFIYNPGQGNLLLDFLIPTIATVTPGSGFGFLTFDTVNTVGDGVFSVVDINNGAATTGTLSTAGVIARFTSDPVGAPPTGVPAPAGLGFLALGAATLAMVRARRA